MDCLRHDLYLNGLQNVKNRAVRLQDIKITTTAYIDSQPLQNMVQLVPRTQLVQSNLRSTRRARPKWQVVRRHRTLSIVFDMYVQEPQAEFNLECTSVVDRSFHLVVE